MRLTSPGAAVPAAGEQARPVSGRVPPTGLALLAALAGGLALSSAFPPLGIWPMAAAGPALLVLALWRQRLRMALAVAAVFGLAFFLPLLSWLVNVAWYVWAALAVVETVIFVVLAAGQWLLLRLRAWPVWVACWWVTAEAVRDRWPWGGFPWGRLAMSQAQAPTVHWVAIGGPPLLSFLIALTGACLAWLVLALISDRAAGRPARWPGRTWRGWTWRGSTWRGWTWPAAGFAAAAGVTMAAAFFPAGQVPAGTQTAVVAAIQGNVPHSRNLPGLLRATTVTQNHASATERLAARVRRGQAAAPDLVIWPENSTDQDPRFNAYIYDTIAGAVADIGKPVLIGAVLTHPVRNAGVLWRPGTGPGTVYVKRRLVPFGEVIPFRGLLRLVTSLPSLQPVNFTPGHRAVIFRVGRIRLGDVICYEVGFDGLVSSEVAAGANLLSVQTNDADFELDGQTGETLQQLDIARIRAIEHDRAVVVASTTGVSAIIAPDGALVASTRTWQPAEIEAAVPLLTTTTLADRAGGWPEGLLTLATAVALCWALAQAVARRRRSDHQVSGRAAE